jgi:hypothetical protein
MGVLVEEVELASRRLEELKKLNLPAEGWGVEGVEGVEEVEESEATSPYLC